MPSCQQHSPWCLPWLERQPPGTTRQRSARGTHQSLQMVLSPLQTGRWLLMQAMCLPAGRCQLLKRLQSLPMAQRVHRLGRCRMGCSQM